MSPYYATFPPFIENSPVPHLPFSAYLTLIKLSCPLSTIKEIVSNPQVSTQYPVYPVFSITYHT